MRIQSTRVEELDRKHPGFRQFVDLQFDAFTPFEEIQRRIEAQYGESLPMSTLSSYKQRRWLVQKHRVEAIKTHATAILELLDRRGISEVRQAMLFEQVQNAIDSGAKLDPHFMLKEERLWAEHGLKRDQLEHEVTRLRSQSAKVKEALGGATQAASEAAADGKPFDAAAALAQINRIIGVGGALEERVESGE